MKKVLLGIGLAVSVLAPGVAAARGDKPVIGVIEFKNESGAGWWSGGVGWELAGMLSNELGATNAFRVVERSKLESVLAEQNLAASGRIAGGTGAKIGQLTGAQYQEHRWRHQLRWRVAGRQLVGGLPGGGHPGDQCHHRRD
jgi:hypothetical protein